VSRNAGSQTRSFSSLMYRKACSTSARSTPGEPLASSILPTQLVAVRGIPVTRMGPPRAVAHLRALASSMTLAAMWGGSSS
jgi:hypothetical protein